MSPELQQFLMQEKAKAQMQQTVAKLTDKCWDTCVGAPGKGLSSREAACLSDCARRFIETTQVRSTLQCIYGLKGKDTGRLLLPRRLTLDNTVVLCSL